MFTAVCFPGIRVISSVPYASVQGPRRGMLSRLGLAVRQSGARALATATVAESRCAACPSSVRERPTDGPASISSRAGSNAPLS